MRVRYEFGQLSHKGRGTVFGYCGAPATSTHVTRRYAVPRAGGDGLHRVYAFCLKGDR